MSLPKATSDTELDSSHQLPFFLFVLCTQRIMILIKGLGQAPSVVNENIYPLPVVAAHCSLLPEVHAYL